VFVDGDLNIRFPIGATKDAGHAAGRLAASDVCSSQPPLLLAGPTLRFCLSSR